MKKVISIFPDNEYLRLFLSGTIITLSVFFFYSIGLAICVPFLLIGYSYSYEASLLNRQSKNWDIDGGYITRHKNKDYLFLGNFLLNVLVPGVFIQVTYFFFYYSTEFPLVLYNFLDFLKTHIEQNNSYFLEFYQKMPVFGFKKDFSFMRGEDSIVIYDCTLFFLFYFVTISTFIVGLIGAFFKINNKSYSRLAKIMYSEDTNYVANGVVKINPKSLARIIFQSLVFTIAPIYLAWKFQQTIFDTKRIFIIILAIYFVSPMFSVFFYNSLSRLRA